MLSGERFSVFWRPAAFVCVEPSARAEVRGDYRDTADEGSDAGLATGAGEVAASAAAGRIIPVVDFVIAVSPAGRFVPVISRTPSPSRR